MCSRMPLTQTQHDRSSRKLACLIHLNGSDERAPPLSDDVHSALDGRQLACERRSHARVSDLRNHNHERSRSTWHNVQTPQCLVCTYITQSQRPDNGQENKSAGLNRHVSRSHMQILNGRMSNIQKLPMPIDAHLDHGHITGLSATRLVHHGGHFGGGHLDGAVLLPLSCRRLSPSGVFRVNLLHRLSCHAMPYTMRTEKHDTPHAVTWGMAEGWE